ncbi:MAG: SIMPL domain-containing protein [Acidobacteriota bacterium]
MTKTLAALALACSLAACGHDRIFPIPQNVERPKMVVTGTATLQVSPDCADLTMTLTADAPRPLAATTQVDKEEDALVAALTKAGVARADLKLSTLSLEPVTAPLPPYAVTGYRAAIVVTVTTRDFTKIGALMEAGAEAGATTMSSQFRRSDLPELKKKVRDMALAAAQDKAKQTAHALGIELGHVVSVGEAPAGVMWSSAYFPQAQANAAMTMNQSSASLGGELQPLTLDITIGYELPTTT